MFKTLDVLVRFEPSVEKYVPEHTKKRIYLDMRRTISVALARFELYTGEISVLFVDDEEIRALNAEHRDIDSPTDVLSFPQYESLEEIWKQDYPYYGDIVISLETARRQAAEYGHTARREITYLAVHSLLHLLGYDHIEEEDKKVMRSVEKGIMKELGIYKNPEQEAADGED